EAMELYADGDDAMLPVLYRQLAPALRRYAVRHLTEPSLAEDVVEHAFVCIHRARGQFVRGASVLAWALEIARARIAVPEPSVSRAPGARSAWTSDPLPLPRARRPSGAAE